VSLIERAAQRLEQLARQNENTIPGAPRRAPEAEPAAPPEGRSHPPERLTQVIDETAYRQRPFVGPQEAVPPRPDPAKRGRHHDLDLAALAAAGFLTPDAPTTQLANEFRVIKRPLIANVKGESAGRVHRANLIMVTSALPSEGKSFTALNLAISIAMELDNTVLLVDGDVAEPALSRMVGLPPGHGLIELLSSHQLSVKDVLLKTNVPKLSIMSAGVPHKRNTELLASKAMTQLLDEMGARYRDRIIIFDSPPLLPTTESRVLATHMGQVVVVVEAERTTHHQVAEAMATIEACPVVMTVLNKATRSDVGTYYGHYRK
jgi:receptor protein-tyrosine kinase